MKNIIFVSLPKVETIYPPAAIAILSSVATKNNYKVKVLDFNLELFNHVDDKDWQDLESWSLFAIKQLNYDLEHKIFELFKNKILEFVDQDTKFIGFSVFSYFSNRIAVLVLNWIKNLNLPVKIIVGGAATMTNTSADNTQIFGDYIIDNNLADFTVFGEGELALEAILQGNTLFPGVNKNNPVQISNLSELPQPTYNYFDMNKYRSKKMLITGSRGCVRKCTFCDIELTWPKFRHRNAQSIVDEIKRNFYDHGVTEFEFTDSLINGSISNFNKFNELLYNEKQKHPELEAIRYQGQFICRPKDQQKEITYELMHLAGCNQLITGIESFSEDVRNHMRKKFSNADIEFHFEQCARWGIPNIVLMIVGYPTETEKDHLDNIHALHKYKKYADMGIIFMIRWGYTMHLYDHTPIMGMIDELEINIDNNIKFDSIYSWVSAKNPSNNLHERLRRRLELHETSVKLGYPMPRVREELLAIKALATKAKNLKQSKSIIIENKL